MYCDTVVGGVRVMFNAVGEAIGFLWFDVRSTVVRR
jgi:hypothetical protein